MKQLFKNILLFSSIALFLLSCSSTKETEMKEQTTDAKPIFIIKVTQNDKSMGEILIQLNREAAPKHVANFESLVALGSYNGTAFHRVIPGFMIQGGDPNSIKGPRNTWGFGDPNQAKVPAEFSSTLKHLRGTISAARSQDPNSASSQFFICVADAPHLNGQYSIFGEVIGGMDVVDNIVKAPRDKNDNPVDKISMTIERQK